LEEGARKGFSFIPIGQDKRFIFERKEGSLKGLEIFRFTHLIFSMKIWDVFAMRRKVRHNQKKMRVIMKRENK
jgi:hypothetical protein